MSQAASQPSLFHESLEEAMDDVVKALGGAKVVGARMRPDLSPDAAARWLKDCLNDGRREHLHPGQVMWLLRAGREAGLHGAMAYLCREIGYGDPVPVEPEDERAQLQREYIEAAKSMARLAERIERANIRAVA